MKLTGRTFVLTLAVAGGIVAFSCRKGPSNNSALLQPVSVRVEIVRPQFLMDEIQVAGTVKAFAEVNLSPEEGGVVREWKVSKGQRVRKGDLVVAFKDEVIRAGYDAAEAQYKIAELSLQKQQKVFAEQGISELQYKSLQFSRDAARANAELMKARWQRTQLRSPIDGIVDNTVPNEGEFAPPGMPIARIVNTSTVKVQAEVPEMYSAAIRTGTPVSMTFDACPGDTLRGTITFVGSTVSTVNRALQVEIVSANPSDKLKPEMVAKVRLMREAKTDALLVSENVIQLVDRDRSIVYVEREGRAEERRVRLGGRQGVMVEVTAGLHPGDRLIVSGYQKVTDGSPVAVIQSVTE